MNERLVIDGTKIRLHTSKYISFLLVSLLSFNSLQKNSTIQNLTQNYEKITKNYKTTWENRMIEQFTSLKQHIRKKKKYKQRPLQTNRV